MKAIVSLATHSERYYKQIDRLEQSLKGRFIGNFLGFKGEESVHAPAHLINNYAFKLFAIAQAKKQGYKKVFWVDSSNYAIKNIEPIFDYLNEHGIFLEDSGHPVGAWSNDECLDYYKVTREQAMKMPMLSSGFIGLDFENKVSKEFFARWMEAMCMGLFNGSWDNHRHDQTCASLIAYQMGIKLSQNCTYFAHVGEKYEPPKETAVFHLQGL